MNSKTLTLAILSILFSFKIFATCQYGIPNASVWGSPSDHDYGFTIDSDITDTDTAQIMQGQDTTVFIQYLVNKLQAIPVGTVVVDSVEIVAITGLPVGINWSLDERADTSNNRYHPYTYRYGVISLCGTTYATPGVKTLSLTFTACGTFSGSHSCKTKSLTLYLEVLASTGGNNGFTMNPQIGCDNVNVNFEALVQSPDSIFNPISYVWNFGDGNTGTGSTVTNNYTLGSYTVQMNANITEYYISNVSLDNISSASDPFWGAVDVYGVFNGFVLSEIGNDDTPSWAVDITINSFDFTGDFTDADAPPINPDDHIGSFSHTINASDLYNNNTITYNASGFDVSFLINERTIPAIFYDTINVYSTSIANISGASAISFCQEDSIVLNLVSTSYDYIQWYNGTDLLIGENSASLFVNSNGNYYAEVLEVGNLCLGTTNTITVTVDSVETPIITQISNGLEVYNPNNYAVQWFSGGVPIPSATNNILTNLLNGSPFSVSFTHNSCVATSSDFIALLAGTSAQSASMMTLEENILFEASGFTLCGGQEIAWAASSLADGAITDMSSLQTAIDNDWIFPSTSLNQFEASCLNTNLPQGEYYMTPVSVDIPSFENVYWNNNTDSAYCDASMEICLKITGSDYSAQPFEIITPNGNTIDFFANLGLSALSIDSSNWHFATSTTGGIYCMELIDLFNYYDNPNGDWVFLLPNSGSGDLLYEIADFNIEVNASSCDSLATDQITFMNGLNGVIAAGDLNGSFTITVPPYPTNFPTVTPNCVLFGEASIFEVHCVSSIDPDIQIANFKLHPNPNNGAFNIEFSLDTRSLVEISLTDITGRKILDRIYPNIKGDFKESFDLKNNLNSGFYFMNIKIENKLIQNKFIVK